MWTGLPAVIHLDKMILITHHFVFRIDLIKLNVFGVNNCIFSGVKNAEEFIYFRLCEGIYISCFFCMSILR